MKARYTDTALLEIEGAVSYLLERNPSGAAVLANLIDAAVARLLDHPHSAEETEIGGVRRLYIRRFRYSMFYTVEEDEVVTFAMPLVAGRRTMKGERHRSETQINLCDLAFVLLGFLG
jgi:addiction module RelE/StbE family toxin